MLSQSARAWMVLVNSYKSNLGVYFHVRYLSSHPGSQPSEEVVFSQQAGTSKEILAVNLSDGTVGAGCSTARAHQPWSGASLKSSLSRQLAATFLPAGYPSSVAPGYLRFVWWQAAHHFAGSVNGVLASTFLLYSVGLGAGAIPTAGALNWVLKDGLGQLGTLLFGKAIAHSFDVNSRMWYLAASTKLNVAMGLEVCTLLAPQLFLPMAAAANAVKGLAWMSGGSCRSAFNVSFAVDGNIADLTAKATSQSICTSVMGTAAGIALASLIGQSFPLALPSFTAVAALHMYTSYHSVRCVPLATLNPSRLQLLISCHLRQLQHHHQQQSQAFQRQQQREEERQLLGLVQRHGQLQEEERQGDQLAGGFPNPCEMARLEPIMATRRWLERSGLPRLCIGASLLELHHRQPGLVSALLPLFIHTRHVLIPSHDGAGAGVYYLVFHEKALAEDCLLAVLHAHLLAHSMHIGGSCASAEQGAARRAAAGKGRGNQGTLAESGGGAGSMHVTSTAGAAPEGVAAVVQSSLSAARQLLPGLLARLAGAKWDVGRVVLETTRRRACW